MLSGSKQGCYREIKRYYTQAYQHCQDNYLCTGDLWSDGIGFYCRVAECFIRCCFGKRRIQLTTAGKDFGYQYFWYVASYPVLVKFQKYLYREVEVR